MSASIRKYDLRPDEPLYYAPREMRENAVMQRLQEDGDHAPPMQDLPRHHNTIAETFSAETESWQTDALELEEMDESEDDSHARSRTHFFGLAAAVAGIACLIAGGLFFFAQIVPGTGYSAPVANVPLATRETPKLQIEETNGAINELVPLGVKVTALSPGATVHLKGLPLGARLTKGVPAGSGEWKIAINELPMTAVVPPREYVGSMNLIAELHGADDHIVSSNNVILRWAPAPAKPAELATPPNQKYPPTTNFVAGAARKITPAELVALIKRGGELATNGDLPAARLLLQRAAEAHNPQAAFALASTYDPMVIKRLFPNSSAFDVTLAKAWYQKAREWGSVEALEKIEALATMNR